MKLPPEILRSRRTLLASGGVALLALGLWVLWYSNSVSVRVLVPGNDNARVFVTVDATYHDGFHYETRALLSDYVPANTVRVFRVRAALPWRFESIRVHAFHPGLRSLTVTGQRNPHWGRAHITISPRPLAAVPDSDSIAVGEIERHYAAVSDLYVAKLGPREAAVQAWPYLEPLRQMTSAVSFRLEPGSETTQQQRVDRMRRIRQQWLTLESSLRSVQYLPCNDRSVKFTAEVPGVKPGCGLQQMLSVP